MTREDAIKKFICELFNVNEKEGVYIDYTFLEKFGCNNFQRKQNERD